MILCLAGVPCTGKTTLAKEFLKSSMGRVISTGDIARKLAKSNTTVQKALKSGELSPVEDEIRMQIINAIETADHSASHPTLILDGFPRYIEQLGWLLQLIKFRYPLYVAMLHTDFEKSFQRERERKRDGIEIVNRDVSHHRWTLQNDMISDMMQWAAQFLMSPCAVIDSNDEIDMVAMHVSNGYRNITAAWECLQHAKVLTHGNKLMDFNAEKVFVDLCKSNDDAHLCKSPVSINRLWYCTYLICIHTSIQAGFSNKKDVVITTKEIKDNVSVVLSKLSHVNAIFAPLARSWFIYSQTHSYRRDFGADEFLSILNADRNEV